MADSSGSHAPRSPGRAKDLGSAAVFPIDSNVLACRGFILLPRQAG